MNEKNQFCSRRGASSSGDGRLRSGGGGNGCGMGGNRGMGQGGLNRTAHRAAHVAQIRADIAATPRGVLSAEERDDLLLMREEEKIARDVYIRMYARWGIRPFDNISGSEQAHMDAILALLEHYGERDPVQGMAIGQFHRADMQALYDGLIEQGLRSQTEAIRVGLLIEELDIADLQKTARRTNKPEIRAVYAELERGSRNHLRAFYRWKQMLGVDYAPQHLPTAEFERTGLSAHEMCA
ncbi:MULTISPECIES: DUF2202 domain-containing protein [Acidithiobacillus]|uniref:DUF2202 domain-containing protein n=1 Tax=Acidithiobacillus ferruginosus TaxID=3063951 RepID=A0ACD5IGU3_9PROT|nr:DUF2202 domain-containing protein [Acidithiobacillus ferruginosus]MBU2813486.1 DUF2202 domain-containing protein [Acidithiobacillus ferruginosus]